MKIDSLSALVSGGATGLGAAVARALAVRGAQVTILDQDEQGEAVAREIGGCFFATDITDDDQVADAILQAEGHHGVARILVNAATLSVSQPLVGQGGVPHPLETFRRAVDFNLGATFNVLSKFAARLSSVEPVGEERGVIINTGSAAGSDGQIGQSAYAAAKAGVLGMTLPLARELAHLQVRVVTISPGPFATPGFLQMPKDLRATFEAQVPHPRRVGAVEEFAQLAIHIIENPFLNGEVIRLDGAMRLGPGELPQK